MRCDLTTEARLGYVIAAIIAKMTTIVEISIRVKPRRRTKTG